MFGLVQGIRQKHLTSTVMVIFGGVINEAQKPIVPVNGAIVVCRLAVYGQRVVRKEPD